MHCQFRIGQSSATAIYCQLTPHFRYSMEQRLLSRAGICPAGWAAGVPSTQRLPRLKLMKRSKLGEVKPRLRRPKMRKRTDTNTKKNFREDWLKRLLQERRRLLEATTQHGHSERELCASTVLQLELTRHTFLLLCRWSPCRSFKCAAWWSC
jgi:hypothetical protein